MIRLGLWSALTALCLAGTLAYGADPVLLEYEYDALGRLTEVKKNSEVKRSYDYDAAGNRTCATLDGRPIENCIPGPKVSMTLSVSPESIIVGQSTTLSWSSEGADHCIGDGGKTIETEGSVTFSPLETRTLEILCEGPDSSTSKTVTVTVHQKPTMTLSFSPSTIVEGQSTTLSWSSTHSDYCIGDGGNQIATSDSMTFEPPATRTLTVSCHGAGGSTSETGTVTVTDPPEPTMTLDFSPSTIVEGQSTTLSWNSTHSDYCIGDGGNEIATSDSLTFEPPATRTVEVICEGPGGTTSETATVIVTDPPEPTMTLNLSPSTIMSGEWTTLSWSSTDTDYCIGDGGNEIATNGSVNFRPSATRTLTVSCYGGGVRTSKTVTVTVVEPKPVMSLGFSPSTITSGQSTTLSWSSENAEYCIGNGGKTIATSDSLTFKPPSTRTLTVSCHGPGGSTSKTATITVN